MIEKGRSITFEGHDGTGKSTQINMLGERLKDQYGIESLVIHEPDGPGISAAIREIIKNGNLPRDAITNLLLFTASRHESNALGEAALEEGTWVLRARDYSSTEAYQGGGEGLDPAYIRKVTEEFTTPGYMNPDLKVILSLPHENRIDRIASRGELERPDTFEMRGHDFQQRVNDTYVEIAARDSLPVIEASGTIDDVHQELMELIWLRGLLSRHHS